MIDFLINLNVTDFIILGIIVLSVIISISRGFIREALSLTTWLIAAYLAFTLSSGLSEKLSGVISSSSIRMIVSFLAIFLLIVIVGAILSFFLGKLISISGLGLIDRILGILFGAARGVLLVALLLLMIQGTALIDRDWWKSSQLIPQFKPITSAMEDLFPKEVEKAEIAIQGKDKAENKKK